LIGQGVRPKDGDRFGREEAARLPEPQGKPAYLAGEAARFLAEHARSPFALYVSILEPHSPYIGPRDSMYATSKVSLPANFAHPPGPEQSMRARLMHATIRDRGFEGGSLSDEQTWKRLIGNYWGLCSLVDTHVGRILDALERSGAAARTIIVFTTDHGAMMGSHQLVGKSVQYEEAIRAPLIVHVPGLAPRRIAGPVGHIDVVPTLLDLLGRNIPAPLRGRSLRPVLEGRAEPDRDVVVEWNADVPEGATRPVPAALRKQVTPTEAAAALGERVRTLITQDGWKLSVSAARREHELYDLGRDPGETRNLIKKAEHRARANDLLVRLKRWQAATADTVTLPSEL
jgi:arylsulfatase A-like enzyme